MRIKNLTYYFLFIANMLFIGNSALSQTTIKGKVIDENTLEPLAFVTIVVDNTNTGFLTDIDGVFNISYKDDIEHLKLSYVGYHKRNYIIDTTLSYHTIKLKRATIELEEVVIFPGENPAHRIINNVKDNRNINNPERRKSFSFTAYNKFILTSDRDLINEKYAETGDSAFSKLSDFLNDKHFFISESVSNKRFRYPNRHTEEVLANRVSGLQNPVFSLLASQLQSFSFYDNFIRILDIEYVSPLAQASLNKYLFELKDTLYNEQDSIFVVSFRPRKNQNFSGMKGVLYINSNKWAVQNVIAHPAVFKDETLEFGIQQQYDFVDGKQWFPVQLNTDITFRVNLEGASDKLPLYGQSRSYLSDIAIDPPLTRKDFSAFDIDYARDVNDADDDFWEKWRIDPLSEKEKLTYNYVDSVGKETNLDRRIRILEALFFGDIKLGFVNLKLNRLYDYNVYEKHRIGIGLSTNSDLSSWARIGGYYAFGTGDKDHKYKINPEVTIDKYRSIKIAYEKEKNVWERGGSDFLKSGYWFQNLEIRSYYVKTMDVVNSQQIYADAKLWRNYLSLRLFGKLGNTYWHDPYEFETSEATYNNFDFFEIGLKMRLAYGEQYIRTPGRIYQGFSKNPVIYLNVTKGFDDVLNGNFDYIKIQSRLEHSYSIPFYGKQLWRLDLGWLSPQNLPLPLLFSPPGANPGVYTLGVSSPMSFGTMLLDEFISEKYAYLFFEHNFQNLFFSTPLYSPELAIITNAGWSSLSSSFHSNISLQSMEKGFYESGIRIDKIIPENWMRAIGLNLSPGIEVLYRYGPYAFPKISHNFVYKISLNLQF